MLVYALMRNATPGQAGPAELRTEQPQWVIATAASERIFRD